MIYTVTFNPAIDYVVHSNHELIPGEVNRVSGEEFYFGGKGINVSVVLSRLGVENTALGFLAGFTGQALLNGLKADGVNSDFIMLAQQSGMTRINVKIKGTTETDINGDGPKIGREALNELMNKLAGLSGGDVLVLAGSIPKSLPDDIYERILGSLSGRDIKFVVDATGELLTNVLKYEPFLIKPNVFELSEIAGKRLETESEIFEAADRLRAAGARNVLVSLGGDGAVLADENGARYKMPAAPGKAVNSVGAGDSMVAGFIAGYLQSGDFKTALRLGSAAGSATALSAGLAKKDDVIKIYNILQEG